MWSSTIGDDGAVRLTSDAPYWRASGTGSTPHAAAASAIVYLMRRKNLLTAIVNVASKHPLVKRNLTWWSRLPIMLDINSLADEECTHLTDVPLVTPGDDAKRWARGFTATQELLPGRITNLELLLAGAIDAMQHAEWITSRDYRAHAQAQYAVRTHLGGLKAVGAGDTINSLVTQLSKELDEELSPDLRARALDTKHRAIQIISGVGATLKSELEALRARAADISRRLKNGERLLAKAQAWANYKAALNKHEQDTAEWIKTHGPVDVYLAAPEAQRSSPPPPHPPQPVDEPQVPDKDTLRKDFLPGTITEDETGAEQFNEAAAVTSAEAHLYKDLLPEVARLIIWATDALKPTFIEPVDQVVVDLKASLTPRSGVVFRASDLTAAPFPPSSCTAWGALARKIGLRIANLQPMWIHVNSYTDVVRQSKAWQEVDLYGDAARDRYASSAYWRAREQTTAVDSGRSLMNIPGQIHDAQTAQQRLERDYIMSFGNELGFRSPGAPPNPPSSSFAQLDGASGVIRNHQQPPPAFHPYQYPPMLYNQAQYLPPPRPRSTRRTRWTCSTRGTSRAASAGADAGAGAGAGAAAAGTNTAPPSSGSSQASLPRPSGIPSPSNLVSSRLFFPV
ncbi:hypothetical protein JCM3770_002117 [Rhodotorula araucariae]